jgi:hypothetical protein
MQTEKIEVVATDSGNTLTVAVFSKRVDRIEVVLGEGIHSVKCALVPTPNKTAYAGSAMGREIVYERTPEQVQADLDRLNPHFRRPGRR